MTNSIAIVMAPVIVATIWADLHFGWGGTMFALREIHGIIGWLAFWR